MFRKFILILFFLLISNAVSAQDKKSALILENDFVRFEFEEGTYGLSSMIDKKTNINHILNGDKPYRLFDITMRNGMQEDHISNYYLRNSSMHPVKAEIQKRDNGTQAAIIIWDNFEFWKEKNAMQIKVTVELPKNSGIAKWRISVDNRSDTWGIWSVDFPSFTNIIKSGEYDFAIPLHNGGKLYENIEKSFSPTYPNQRWSSQFFSLSNGKSSIYYAALDPDSRKKKLSLIPGKEFSIKQYAENMAVPGSDYNDYFAQAFGVYTGNWIDAAKRYRKWALQQVWTSKGKKSQRNDMPDIIKNVALWFVVYANYDSVDDIKKKILDASEKLGVPIGVHWYRWNTTPFDNGYPHFFPARDGFKEAVKELTAKGILVMPYINGFIVDADNDDFNKYLPYTVKDFAGAYKLNTYGRTSGRMVAICPEKPFWKNVIAGVVDTLTGEFGVNGVYIDQISAVMPVLCFDKTHGHTLGSGAYWVKGYRKVLEKSKKIAESRGAIIVSENTIEAYMNVLDGFLSFHSADDIDIPMLQMVYSDYTNYVGGAVKGKQPMSDKAFIMAEGRFYIWGFQNGRMTPWFMAPGHEKKAEYFKKIGEYRVATRKYVTYSELMDLIKPINKIPMVTDVWINHSRKAINVSIPSVQAALWKAEDGDLALILVNLDDKVHEAKYVVDTSKYGVKLSKNAHYVINHITPGKKTKLGTVESNKIERTEKMKPYEIKVLEISETED